MTSAHAPVIGSPVNGVHIQTVRGISVGSSRAEVFADRGWAVWDQNGDGVGDQLGLGHARCRGHHACDTMPGTPCLGHYAWDTCLGYPGSTGIRFPSSSWNANARQGIQSPSDDLSEH